MENGTSLIMRTAENDEYLNGSVIANFATTASDGKNYDKRDK